jgi:hypothetical protein
MKKTLLIFSSLLICSCASLYHVQVADVETTDRGRVIDIKLSETAFDIKGAASTGLNIAKRNAVDRGSRGAQDKIAGLELILAVSNFGPRTGVPVFTDKYSDYLLDELVSKCPYGRITGLTSVREARKYPYISGEIINLRGYCVD